MLDRLDHALRNDERLAAMLLVGSGAYGFRDDESDIDIVAPVLAEHDATAVFQDWKQRIETVVPMSYRAETAFTEQRRLLVLLCSDRLEVDLSFPRVAELAALTPNWRILWDRKGDIAQRMAVPVQPYTTTDQQAYTCLVNRAVHRAVYASKAVRRGQTWRALLVLDELRSRAVQLACLAAVGQSYTDVLGTDGVERHVDALPAEVLAALRGTLPSRVDAESMKESVQGCITMVFQQVTMLDARFGIERTLPLDELLAEHLTMSTPQRDKTI
jgi:hypothetical protein